MIEKLANSIAVFLCKEGVVSEEEKDICRYGAEVIISNVIGVVLILVIGVLLKSLWQGILFLLLYSTLRIYTGGYHASSYLKCNSGFVVVYIITLLLFTYVNSNICRSMAWVGVCIGLIIVVGYAPVPNVNRIVSGEKARKYKYASVVIYLLIMIMMVLIDIMYISGLGYMVYWADVSLYIKYVLISIVILMLVAMHGNKHQR